MNLIRLLGERLEPGHLIIPSEFVPASTKYIAYIRQISEGFIFGEYACVLYRKPEFIYLDMAKTTAIPLRHFGVEVVTNCVWCKTVVLNESEVLFGNDKPRPWIDDSNDRFICRADVLRHALAKSLENHDVPFIQS